MSERDIIDGIRAAAHLSNAAQHGVLVGIGDDAAVLTAPPGRKLVLTCDSLSEGVDFRRQWASLADIGRRSAMANLSDLAAMGATPCGLLLCLNLPDKAQLTPGNIIHLCKQVHKSGLALGAPLLGGDIGRFRGPLTLTITAAGWCDNPLRRGRGRAGHIVAVTGSLGDAAAGLRILETWRRGARANRKPRGRLVERLLRPTARVAFALALSPYADVLAVADISDGLARDSLNLLPRNSAKSSSPSKSARGGLAMQLRSSDLPISPALRRYVSGGAKSKNRRSAVSLALHGGDDYELVISLPAALWPELADLARSCATPLTAIGHIAHASPGQGPLFVDGTAVAAAGYDHFPSADRGHR